MTPSSGTPVARVQAMVNRSWIVGPTRRSGASPHNARADIGRMMRSTTRYHTALVLIPPRTTVAKMYSAAEIVSVTPSNANTTAPMPHMIADIRAASAGAASTICRSVSVGGRPAPSHRVPTLNRRLRFRSSTGTATVRNTASVAPPRSSRRSVASGLSRIGAAKAKNSETIPPPAILIAAAPQTQRVNVTWRNASRPGRPVIPGGDSAHSASMFGSVPRDGTRR
ncbi:hypothetical protein MTY414_00360 [Mycolicibacterium mageritense]|nr:hypothetical protein MTY414_00360 [Mycolicibacterium mageritense]